MMSRISGEVFLPINPFSALHCSALTPWTFLMKRSSVVMFFCLAACSVAIAQTKRALLIGIDTYEPPGTRVKVPAGTPAEGRFAAGITFANLQGPTHDVDAMRDLLTSA